jgi:glycosyltransferase involved in cell wall biosynthesis
MLRRRAITRAMGTLGMENPILWLCRPWQADVVGRYDESLLLYHVVDEYAVYEGEFTAQLGSERRHVVERWDRRLMEQADLVIVTAPALLKAKKSLNPNTHLVRNGANVTAFRDAMSGEVPDDMAGIPRPIIGCAGAINEKIDLELLRDIAQARPDWSLALIGPVTQRFFREQLQWLESPNVFFLGSKPVDELPRYVTSCDVCLMPYKINEWTRHIDPLKLYEYLAAGRPIVSSAIPSATDFGPPLRIAHDARGFVREIEVALAEASMEQSLRFAALAERHDWDSRAEQVSSHISDTLAGITSL